MFEVKRYILIDSLLITPEIINACEIIDNPRHCRFANDPTDWVVLKWITGSKPEAIWGEFPVYSDQEMRDILENDITQNNQINGTTN